MRNSECEIKGAENMLKAKLEVVIRTEEETNDNEVFHNRRQVDM